ncbi:SRPBCC family protein [Saccharothrix australiensis]|uniref:Polyketide cyclase/dehydrase/lipid transport protein n=1 Tax=Saccharothrix australiensis TaxID=2072 RepID=A0A495VYZ1_9PSEU|nr:polyketide cyclase/dehydrase/lipid transport protein [Saccharothrix australiensis]
MRDTTPLHPAGLPGPARRAHPPPDRCACRPARHPAGRRRPPRRHRARRVKAPLSTVWQLQADVERRPSRQPPVTGSERLDRGPLRSGSRFRWTTPVPATPTTPATTLTITSTVRQLQHHRCIRWTGAAIGEGLTIDRGVHAWTFTRVEGGVLVRTEETWTGDQVEADVPTSVHFLGEGLKAWPADLRTAAEARHRG